jgi:hypothetical protein
VFAASAPRSSHSSTDCISQRPPPRSTDEKWVHDAFQGPGAARKPFGSSAAIGGTAMGFTGLSPRIEVSNIHYEVTPADLKVSLDSERHIQR